MKGKKRKTLRCFCEKRMKNKHTRRAGETRDGRSDSLKYVVRISFICSSSASAESHLARVSSELTTRQLQWSKNLSWLKLSVVILKATHWTNLPVRWLRFHKLSRDSSSTFAPMRCERASDRTKTGFDVNAWRHPSTSTCKYFSVDSKMRNHMKRFFVLSLPLTKKANKKSFAVYLTKLNGISWVMIFSCSERKKFSCLEEKICLIFGQ